MFRTALISFFLFSFLAGAPARSERQDYTDQAQREFVKKSDQARMEHAATMGIIAGGASQSAVLESARKARAAAESRKAEIRRRAFAPVTTSPDQPTPCSELG